MKKFALRVVLFPLPILGLLLALPMDKEWQFKHHGESCLRREAWMYDRIHQDEAPIDLLFLGSSHTINAIDGFSLQGQLSQGWQVVNMGYCFFGRDLHRLLLEEVLEKKRPKAVVVEVRQKENKGGHRLFPYLATSQEVLLSDPLGSGKYVKNLKAHLLYKLKFLNSQLGIQQALQPYEGEGSGFFSLPDTASIELLEAEKEKRWKRAEKQSSSHSFFNHPFPQQQLRKMASLCQEQGIRLMFLYLPSFGEPKHLPSEIETYRAMGELMLPPKEILENPNHWYDEGHLNVAGATQLTEFVAKWMQQNVQN